MPPGPRGPHGLLCVERRSWGGETVDHTLAEGTGRSGPGLPLCVCGFLTHTVCDRGSEQRGGPFTVVGVPGHGAVPHRCCN